MKHTGGLRRGTRHKFRKNVRDRGKISLTRYFQEFKEGERVAFVAETAIQKGLYPRRYHGSAGVVRGKKGSCYIVEVKGIREIKSFIVHPVHLKKV